MSEFMGILKNQPPGPETLARCFQVLLPVFFSMVDFLLVFSHANEAGFKLHDTGLAGLELS